MIATNTTTVQTRFVDLITRTQNWRSSFSPEDEQIFFDLVSAVGFHPKAITIGQLHGNWRDQDGSSTGKTYSVNAWCPYKVVGQDNEDNFLATGWLDCAVQYVSRLLRQDKSQEEIAEALRVEIIIGIPLKPIILTDIGDKLLEYPPLMKAFGLRYFVDHTGDNNQLSTCVGVHAICGGWVDRKKVTQTHDAIRCRECNLRVPFPKHINTYGELRRHFAMFNP